jgi:hypothetical protein
MGIPGVSEQVSKAHASEECRIGVLRVEAEASTDSRPRDGFTPRRGAGLPIFGKSQSGPPARKHMRIDFQFDKAAFDFRCALLLVVLLCLRSLFDNQEHAGAQSYH